MRDRSSNVGGGSGSDHTYGKVAVDFTDQDHGDAIAAFGESIPKTCNHRTRASGGDWCEFGCDEDDVHGTIVAESGT